MNTRTDPTLAQAVRLAKSGNKAGAVNLLAQVLRENPENEAAWLWLAASLDDPEKQRYCLRRALAIHPDNLRVRQALYNLEHPQTVMPVEEAAPTQPMEEPVAIPFTGAIAYPVSTGAQVFPFSDRLAAGETPAIPPAPAARRKGFRWGILVLVGAAILLAVILYFVWAFFFQQPAGSFPSSLALGSPFAVRVAPGPGLAEAIRNAAPGTTLALSAGNYSIDNVLEIRQPIQIVGAGMDKTQILLKQSGVSMHIQGAGPFSFKDLELRYDGKDPADLIVVDGGAVNFTGCRIAGAVWGNAEGYGGRGLVLQGTATGTVQHCEVVNNDYAGIDLRGNANLTIAQNLIHQNQGNGINVAGSAVPIISGNEMSENTQTGLAYYDSSAGKATGNQIHDNNRSGIEVNGASAPVLAQNTSVHNQTFGVQVTGQGAPMLISNTFKQNGKAGLAYFGQSSGGAQDNDCSENEMHGISINDHATPFLQGNRCQQNKQVGIDYWGDAGGTATNNNCSENGLQGISVHEHAAPVLENNTCQKNSDSGIVYWETARGAARNNDCSQNGINGISIHNQANPSLSRNSCTGNSGAGIAYYERSGGIAHDNECTGNGQNEILKSDQASPVLDGNHCAIAGGQ